MEPGGLEDLEIPAALAGVRLDRAVSLVADLTRKEAALLVDAGAVTIGGLQVRDRARKLREHEHLGVDTRLVDEERASAPLPVTEKPVAFEVCYEDDDVIVVNKPPGVVVHPGAGNRAGTLASGLLERYPELGRLPAAGLGEADRPGMVHRLDKDTSGLLVVARSEAAFRSLTDQLATRKMGRTYLAIVLGRLEAPEGVIDAPIGRSSGDPTRMAVSSTGKTARTAYRLLRRFESPVEASLVELRLETGRTHQIRVHCAAIGHPVLGDRRYGGARGSLAVGRPMLHAAELRFVHPRTGEELSFHAPAPGDFTRALDLLS